MPCPGLDVCCARTPYSLLTDRLAARYPVVCNLPRTHPHIEGIYDTSDRGGSILAWYSIQSFYHIAIADTGIAELGSVFYSVREKNFDDRGARRQADREFSKRAELETEMAKQREAYVERLLFLACSLVLSDL